MRTQIKAVAIVLLAGTSPALAYAQGSSSQDPGIMNPGMSVQGLGYSGSTTPPSADPWFHDNDAPSPRAKPSATRGYRGYGGSGGYYPAPDTGAGTAGPSRPGPGGEFRGLEPRN
jgi:hypothetical protein